MNRDFRVGQSNELLKALVVYDLHNCYDYKALLVLGRCDAFLYFEPNPVHGVGLAAVVVAFLGLDHLEMSPRFASSAQATLDEIGYKKPGDRDLAWLLGEDQAGPEDHLFFSFEGGEYLRIHSNEASLRETRAFGNFDPLVLFDDTKGQLPLRA